jgi:hypothetical protein
LALLIVWVFAAFGEEFAYRGYLLSRASTAGGGSSVAHWVGVVLAAVLFGLGHYYKGPFGIVDSGVAGLVLGSAYMLSGREPLGGRAGTRTHRHLRGRGTLLRVGVVTFVARTGPGRKTSCFTRPELYQVLSGFSVIRFRKLASQPRIPATRNPNVIQAPRHERGLHQE